MSNKILGVDIFEVTTTPKHELGIIVEDPRGGEGIITFKEVIDGVTTTRRFDAGGSYKYVRGGTGGVLEGNAVQIEIAAIPVVQRHAVVVNSGATTRVEGIPMAAIPAASFGFIQIEGVHYNANVADAVADGAFLVGGAAGAFVATTAAPTVDELEAIAGGRGAFKLADASTLVPAGSANRGVVLIRS